MISIKNSSSKILMVILDGYGINSNTHKNAIKDANTPTLDELFTAYPYATIEAGGEAVGLPKGVAGNSEVGHINLGAGRPVRQDLVRINESLEKKQFHLQENFKKLIYSAQKNTKRIHLMVLLSDGGVHSHIEHLKEAITQISKNPSIEIFLHAFMDGRDTPQKSGLKYINALNEFENLNFASMQGRSIAMDRDNRWEKIQLAYDTFSGNGFVTNLSPEKYLLSQYGEAITDEFITPTLFNKNYAMKDDDCIFFLNFRPDRAIQLSLAINDPKFSKFKRHFTPSFFLCMTPYIPDEVELPILFNKEKVSGGLSEYLSSLGHSQLKIAETEKYAHVTFFFNGGEKRPFENEEHILVASPKEVKTYDEKPEMSAMEITNKLMVELEKNDRIFYLVNYANSDMVGHTGNYNAAVLAIETLDKCFEQLQKKCLEKNITIVLTADHGNADQMVYEDDSIHTSHTNALVPFAIFNNKFKNCEINVNSSKAALKDVAPTILYMLGIKQPDSFTGQPIFK